MNEAMTLEEHRRRDAAGTLHKRPVRPDMTAEVIHGLKQYRRGCRCATCREAYTTYRDSPAQVKAQEKRNARDRKKRAADKAALKKQGAKKCQ
jgi:hypothetical protein